jgi:signal transduction histidine kinase
MISTALKSFIAGVSHLRNHPQVLFALALLIVIPLLFVYTGSQFLDVGRANQDKLGKDRVGLLHDAFASLLIGTTFNMPIVQTELANIKKLNTDLLDYAVVQKREKEFVYVVAYEEQLVGTSVVDPSLFANAALRNDESLIFELNDGGIRYWAGYRAVYGERGELYFVYTLFSLEHIDALFKDREARAYYSLIFIYCFMIALAYWHIRLTDYRFLFMKAKKANEMKDIFTHMIAHELRSPLTAIRGYAGLLSERLTDPTQKEESLRIALSAERLLAIVNDLLDVARIQSGKMSIAPVETDVSPVIVAATAELAVMAKEKSIKLKLEGTEIAHVIFIDPKRLHQAIINLVTNAIKYTPKGAITIELKDVYVALEIRVKDTGMGISADDQKKLFAPFFRVAETDVTKITGTGLGMWITKQLIEIMGGTIGVESIKGVGTHIVVTLPKSLKL